MQILQNLPFDQLLKIVKTLSEDELGIVKKVIENKNTKSQSNVNPETLLL